MAHRPGTSRRGPATPRPGTRELRASRSHTLARTARTGPGRRARHDPRLTPALRHFVTASYVSDELQVEHQGSTETADVVKVDAVHVPADRPDEHDVIGECASVVRGLRDEHGSHSSAA